MPAETVFESPHEVYFNLRSDPGGIAQWMLPAVYGGHFRCIWWVRPSWAEQIADGEYNIMVGRSQRRSEVAESGDGAGIFPPQRARDARQLMSGEVRSEGASWTNAVSSPPETIRVSCAEPYFVEDGTYCPESELVAAKPLRLLVSQLPLESADSRAELHLNRGSGWTLDVCLDYFACGNPFLNGTRPNIASPFAAAQNAASFRQSPVDNLAAFYAKRSAFDAAYAAVLRGEGSDGSFNSTCGESQLEALGCFLPEDRREALLADLRVALRSARESELQQILEAGDMVTLPLHPATEGELKERLAAFKAFVSRLCSDRGLGTRPSAVTIARSVVDGFCPMRWLCVLEQGVFEVLRECFDALDVVYADELAVLEKAR